MRIASNRYKVLSLAVVVIAPVFVLGVRPSDKGAQKQQPVQEQPTALIEKNERHKQESLAYSDPTRLNLKDDAGRLTSEAKRLNRDVTFLIEDGSTILPITPEPPAIELLKDSIVAVRGRIENKQSFLTDDETAIFTEYQVSVSEVFKSKSGVAAGDTVFVTRPGGSVLYEGHILRDEHSRYKPLEAGADCLLFLKEGKAQGTYVLHQAISIDGEELAPHVSGPPDFRHRSAAQALNELRAARGGNSQ
jgi:hypothetical protein